MVGDLEHVGRQVHAGGEQGLLGVDLGVAGQQEAHTVDRRPEHDRGVVRVGAGVAERRGRRQHVEVDVTDVERPADRRAAEP